MYLAQRGQPRNIAQSSLNCHKSNALQKDNFAIYGFGHGRGHMRTQCVKSQQHANNLRRNNDLIDAEIFLTAIWLPRGQLWVIIEKAASLTQC